MESAAHPGIHRGAEGNGRWLSESRRDSLATTPRLGSAGSKTGQRGDYRVGYGKTGQCGDHRVRPTRITTASACEPFREAIEQGLSRGRNAMAIWQNLVADCGFAGSYQSVQRFVRKLDGNRCAKPGR